MAFPSVKELVLLTLIAIVTVIIGVMMTLLMVVWLGIVPAGASEPPVSWRCDGVTEVCRSDPDGPWPHSRHMPALCEAKPVFCQFVEGRPTNGALGYPQIEAGTPQDEVIWEIWAAFKSHSVSSVDDALAVAWCESNLIPTAKNRRSSASGPFQMLSAFYRYQGAKYGFPEGLEHRFDPRIAAQLTAKVVEADGSWSQWLCRSVLR